MFDLFSGDFKKQFFHIGSFFVCAVGNECCCMLKCTDDQVGPS